MERLDKLLAATGKWSRKEAKALIKAGRVRVEDRLPKGPEDKVEEGSLVTVDGRPIFTEKYVYLMLHKPAGVISATQDAKEKTVLDLLPKAARVQLVSVSAGKTSSPWGGWTRTRRGCSS